MMIDRFLYPIFRQTLFSGRGWKQWDYRASWLLDCHYARLLDWLRCPFAIMSIGRIELWEHHVPCAFQQRQHWDRWRWLDWYNLTSQIERYRELRFVDKLKSGPSKGTAWRSVLFFCMSASNLGTPARLGLPFQNGPDIWLPHHLVSEICILPSSFAPGPPARESAFEMIAIIC